MSDVSFTRENWRGVRSIIDGSGLMVVDLWISPGADGDDVRSIVGPHIPAGSGVTKERRVDKKDGAQRFKVAQSSLF